MPSLADLKTQLAIQLYSTLERKLMHEKQQTLNIYGPRFTFSREELRDDETTVPNDCAVKTPKHSLLAESVDLTGGSIFKWNKRFYAEEHSVLPTDAADCLKSPKLRHLRAKNFTSWTDKKFNDFWTIDEKAGN
jgi:hypothetical protein